MNTVQGIQEVSQEFKKCKCLEDVGGQSGILSRSGYCPEDVGGQSGILSRGCRMSVRNTVQRM